MILFIHLHHTHNQLLLLSFLEITYQTELIEFYPSKQHKAKSFLEINPLGQLPVIIDNGRLALTGSLNLTHAGFENNVETLTQVGRPPLEMEEDGNQYMEIFEQYWQRYQGKHLPALILDKRYT